MLDTRTGLFSFKNYRLIGFTESLSCRSGRAKRNPTGSLCHTEIVQINAACACGMLRVSLRSTRPTDGYIEM